MTVSHRPEAVEGPPAGELAELVAATGGLQPWRRAMHALTGVVLVWVPWASALSRTTVVLVLGAAFAFLLAVDLVRLRRPPLNAFLFRVLRPLVSPREAAAIASSTWYAAGALATYALFPRPVAMAAILVLAFADPAAGLVGRAFGRRRVGKGSVEGGVAFFAVALVVLLAVLGVEATMVLRAVVTAALATAVELAPLRVDDNVTVPLTTALALRLLLGVG